MKTKKCKYCGKEVNINAEICPHCGCRLKSNTLKIVIICLVIIMIIGCLYMLLKNIKANITRHEKIESKEKTEELEKSSIEKYTNLVNSYKGNYVISYNNELFNKEHPFFDIKDNISIINKIESIGCIASSQIIINDGETKNNFDYCDFSKDIKNIRIGTEDAWDLIKDGSNYILSTDLRNLVSASHANDASEETMNEMNLYSYKICFRKKDNILEQIECPSDITNDKLDTKYGFKLTKQ